MDEYNYYNQLLQGDSGSLKRALYKSMGFTDAALEKPLIAIVNTYTNATPGHFNINDMCEQVTKGIESAGGTAMVFGSIAPCDGIAEGHDGMRYILPSRDLITSSVECMVRAHKFDGVVLLGSCDKIVPGLLMAAARLDIPAIFCNSGPMMPAVYKNKHYDGNIVTFGDLDGVLVIPKEVETEVIQKAYEKATGEKMVAEAIRGGMGAKESFDKHGIM